MSFLAGAKLTEDIETLNTIYGDESYAFANISPNVKKDLESDKVIVDFCD